VHDPDVLILDEPTDGLDPNQKHEVRELIRSMSAEKLIVISTHILEEVEAVCSRAIIIAQGKILADDTPDALAMRSHYHNAVRLRIPAESSIDEVRAAIEKLPSVSSTEADRERGIVTAIPSNGPANGATWREVSDLVAEKGWNITGLQLQSGHLDEVFRDITSVERA
jgi:ABC-2 type transport system ATP-binding protein